MMSAVEPDTLFYDIIEWRDDLHVVVACRQDQLVRVRFVQPSAPALTMGVHHPARVTFASRAIRDYLAGKRRQLDLSLSAHGTPFQCRVWQTIQDIPYGSVKTYGEVAQMMGASGAARAVGTALGKNPIPIVIPCHRIVAAHGMGGFTGGLVIKRALLQLEGHAV
jgi:O-6-methylguanine DNA methyltransferase